MRTSLKTPTRITVAFIALAVAATLASTTGCKRPEPPTPATDDTATEPAKPEETAEGGGMKFIMISPTTGEVTVNTTITGAPGTVEYRDQLRTAMGMPTQAIADAAAKRIAKTELGVSTPVEECRYIGLFNTFAYLDPAGKMWTGTKYHGGRFPVLGYTGDKVMTVVEDSETPKGMYTIVYMTAERLTDNFADTEWAEEDNEDAREFAEICDYLPRLMGPPAPKKLAPKPASAPAEGTIKI